MEDHTNHPTSYPQIDFELNRVLTMKGLEVNNDLDISEHHLLDDYKEFWHAIDHALYRPIVHRDILANYPSLNGIWLGLSRHS